MSTKQLVERLKRIRLEENLPYRELADKIGIPEATLYKALNEPERQLLERTRFQMERYLSAHDAPALTLAEGEAR